jgi:chorismate mutase
LVTYTRLLVYNLVAQAALGADGKPGGDGGEGEPVAVRAIRGAVQVDANESAAILEGTSELVTEVMTRNQLTPGDVISVVFSATTDLNAEFPALAARKLGFQDVPLLCCTEIAVPGAMPRVVRLMMHVETEVPRSAIQHVYLRGAAALRLDIAQ